jgi:DNA-binding CsgD family transcriptional regulator
MQVRDSIHSVDSAHSVDELKSTLQKIIENFGFSGFSFLDVGRPHLDEPFYFGTTGAAWEGEYRKNGFVHVDPCIVRARRTSAPFSWDNAPLPRVSGKHKPKAHVLMEAAHDHGFANGYVFPFHLVDSGGDVYTVVNGLFWKGRVSEFKTLMSTDRRIELDLVLSCWMQRVIETARPFYKSKAQFIDYRAFQRGDYQLSDRERQVLAWAARGLTVSDTSEVLKISEETVRSHMRNSIRKLEANSKTHAVAKAIVLGYIDL